VSTEAIAVYDGHRAFQVENGPFSQEFTTTPGGDTFRGTLDHSHVEDNKDDGNVRQKTRKMRILVGTVPAFIDEGVKIADVDGRDRTVSEVDLDLMGVPVIWLY